MGSAWCFLPAAGLLAATYTVTTTNDTGAGSLRQAILSANGSAVLDTIRFNLPGEGTHTIAPRTELPAITRPVVIDGSTQPGFLDRPLIQLQGSNLFDAAGLRVFAGATTVRSLMVCGFGDAAIRLEENGGNQVVGNFLGTDASGTNPAGNRLGLLIGPNCSRNTIGGTNLSDRNVISGNAAGILVSAGAAENVIQGNHVGVDLTGERAAANDSFGMMLSNCVRTTVGGIDPVAGNVLSGNADTGLSLLDGASANQVQGNRIGVNRSGNRAVPNGYVGVEIVEASENTIGGIETGAGNVISGNGNAGIRIEGSTSQGNVVQGNLIGLDAAGDGALGNGWYGLDVFGGRGTTIGGVEPGAGNVISGNARIGVVLDGRGHVLQGNRIGTDWSGTRARPNSVDPGVGAGVLIHGSDHTIGGDAGAGNTISGNASCGVILHGSNHVVQGNYVGADISGTNALGNGWEGLWLEGATHNTIGGVTPAERNVIVDNESGLRLDGIGVWGNAVQGNYIGVGADGLTPLGNRWAGVLVQDGAHDNLLGGTEPGQGNVIADNDHGGIQIEGGDGTVVQGNRIGTDETGRLLLPNHQAGIDIFAPARNSLIGGTAPGAGNRIAFNERDGVAIWGDTAVGHTVVGNSIHDNLGSALDLEGPGEIPDAPSPNDPLDRDTGPNHLQNFPVITNITVNAGVTIVRGILQSAPNRDYAIDLYHSASADLSGSGQGQGEVYAGGVDVSTDDQGMAGFIFFTADDVAERRFSATATDLELGDTSEFSLAFPNTSSAPELGINDVTVSEGEVGSGLAVFTVTLSEPTGQPVIVNYSTVEGTARAGEDFVATNGVLVLAPGQKTGAVIVVLVPKPGPEGEETFSVNLTSAVNATIADGTGRATILELRITSIRQDGVRVEVEFTTSATRRYALQRTDSLGPGATWGAVTAAAVGTGGIMTAVDTNAPGDVPRFYRIWLVPTLGVGPEGPE